MEEKIVRFLNEHNMMITTVESCTGGLIAARLVNVSGASNVFSEGYITYSEDAKAKMVGVNPETIKKYNVVSEEVAYEMASGGAKTANADVAVSVTGVAGPLGGTKDIPVGTVCIGVYYKNKVITEKFLFNGDRLQVRNQAVDKALEMVWNEFNNR
ncbi:CinA family protein [Bovifimicola ammoniilytica]|uniref:CinA family protein n=1 Tax=Bovifimicola ammoniilytica TaxID=2981720 RepID=UPI0021D16B64|nr:CinA family protein [Bovifimicola ammoniilytica]MCU6752548.1 CinA family protein [Bovifimicola ammoniilytica]